MEVYFYFILFLCVVFNRDVSCKKHGRMSKVDGGRIVGGYNTTIQQVPYQVYMIVQKPGNKYYQCGGSIIGPRYVLTAAHCLTGVIRVYIRAGSTESDTGGKVYTTSLYTQHPRYNAANSDYDVAVVRLLQKMTLDGTDTRVISLPPSNTAVQSGTDILVSGWGTTSENGNTSRNLMAVTVPVVATSECERAYNNAITARMFCAGVSEGGKDSCQGDSGGPAVDESSGLQVGVVSFGRGCAQPGYPGVYTNVSNVRDFIKRQTGI
ncbi:trypsin-7-like [Cydia splendana]|uniref:trypsin-7-like n=1 Tax=Cydia splendana TaxID=1100963 RepID=UPI00213A333A